MKLRAIFALLSAALLTVAFAFTASAGPPPCTDTDSDGVCDPDDNCVATANPDQSDGDSDGYGEACDIDTNNDCFITAADIGATLAAISGGQTEPPPSPYDVNLDGFITAADIGAILPGIGPNLPPGPSGKSCASCGTGEPTGQGAAGACP